MRYVSIAAITIGISETKKVHRIYYSMNLLSKLILVGQKFNFQNMVTKQRIAF